MRVTHTPPIRPTGYRETTISTVPPAVVLHNEGKWYLLDATTNRYNTRQGGWNSVIKHHCSNRVGSPYWMLIECHTSPTVCTYCNEEMPPSIVCLFKLQNMEIMR